MVGILLNPGGSAAGPVVNLPAPSLKGRVSVEEALQARRTVRRFAHRALSLTQLSQLLWAADGVTDPRRGYRSAPSAGALYPLDLYVAVGERSVADLPPGVYHYLPDRQGLELITKGDIRKELARAALYQSWMAEAPIMVVITAEYARCTQKYGQRGLLYTHIEVGHVGQNLFLQAEALSLGAGIVGAFENQAVSQIMGLPPAQEPLLIMPIGYKH
ncbi:MAG: SagB/ThcOx family dehydrogenase [Desulfobacca sp.]|nr:SagB/ThcOx family dehydrogenase [Desulfobacca sp.]